jgi:hypothetical protein
MCKRDVRAKSECLWLVRYEGGRGAMSGGGNGGMREERGATHTTRFRSDGFAKCLVSSCASKSDGVSATVCFLMAHLIICGLGGGRGGAGGFPGRGGGVHTTVYFLMAHLII